jgi:site-specific DNA recombinase
MSTNRASKEQQTAVIYARVSSEEQVQGYSIQAQLRACREWAGKHGYKVAKEYLDEGYSASRNLDKRESFKEMLGDAASKSHPFDTIIVHKLDRFSRDSLESFTSKAILKRHKVRLISVQEPVVGSDAPEDAFMEHILVGMAEFYSKNLAREIRKGLTERIRQGFLVFRPPYGYRREVIEKREGQKRTRTISRPVVDEAAAGVVRRIFELCDRGVGYKEITKILNSDGLRTAQGKRFASNHIYWILRNKAYVGVLEYNFRERYGAVEPMTIPGFYPAIIDQELFDRVQRKLRLSAANWRNSYANRTTYLLSGLVVCDACGRRYLGTAAKGGKFHYYSCGSYLKGGKETCAARLINKDKLESAVLAKIQGQILTPTNIRSYIQRVMESALKSQDNPSPEQEAVRLALNDVQTRLQRWENALESGELSIEHAAQRIKELHEQRQELLNKKQALDRNRPGVKRISAIPTAHMDAYVAEMQRRLAVKQIGSKREFLQEVLKEVRVRGNNVSLTYKLPLRTSEVRFFTPLRLVGPPGLEPGTNRL